MAITPNIPLKSKAFRTRDSKADQPEQPTAESERSNVVKAERKQFAGASSIAQTEDLKIAIPEYCEFSKDGRWDVCVNGCVTPIRTSYQGRILQPRVNGFWNALRDGKAAKELISFFDESLSPEVREEIQKFRASAMAALGDYDLRFADSIAFPVIREVVGNWLDRECKKSRKSRGDKPHKEVKKRRESLRSIVKLPENLGDQKKLWSLFASLGKDMIPIPGNKNNSTNWLSLLDDQLRKAELESVLSVLRKDFER